MAECCFGDRDPAERVADEHEAFEAGAVGVVQDSGHRVVEADRRQVRGTGAATGKVYRY
jgi:hypothetical protein